ncbi:MAG: hypothetical protein N3A69_04510 [Leptospiraceae bacterium]|nr:hypothetical protein [Leptospiraceae bacterium]
MNYENLEKFIQNLQLQYENYQSSSKRTELTNLDRETIAESVIQRFEICYDTL